MSTFSASTRATAVVPVERDRIWEVLTDPDLIARFTPFISGIEERDQHWIWTMSGLKVLGKSFGATFTEQMTLHDHSRIEFTHDPPAGRTERASVTGFYALEDADGGTHLETSLEVCVDLPLPRVSGLAVRTAMKGVMGTMGDRFSANLLHHFGVS